MTRSLIVCLYVFLLQNCLHSQSPDPKAYHGYWEASVDPLTFSNELIIGRVRGSKWRVRLKNSYTFYDRTLSSSKPNDKVELQLGEDLHFIGKLSPDGEQLAGFLTSMTTKYRLTLHRTQADEYVGSWNSLYVDRLQPAKLYLEVYITEGGVFEAYLALPDDRYRGPYSSDYHQEAEAFGLVDLRSGYRFRGTLDEDAILLDAFIGNARVTPTPLVFTRSVNEWKFKTTASGPTPSPANPPAREDGWATGTLAQATRNTATLDRLEDSIRAEVLVNVHSVLVAHRGTLVYENYFNGFHADLPQDQRSAAKSFASALVGIALEDGVIGDVDDKLYDYLPEKDRATVDEQKAKITLRHLLTMRSGLDIVGEDGQEGQAGEDRYQESADWLRTVLTAPLAYPPGQRCEYGSANPFLLGVVLASSLEVPLEDYLHDRLLAPLQITNYTLPLDTDGRPYLGGGMYLIPRDMLKFGELYRAGGLWNGLRILPQSWIAESFVQYAQLENTRDKNPYGYLFWHEAYAVGDQTFSAVEARGAGGQYISVIPDLELVIVVTSGNYRNGRSRQPGQIIERYVLPAFAD